MLDEPESADVQAAAARHDLVSSRLLLVESRRAVIRLDNAALADALEQALEEVSLVEIGRHVTAAASRLRPPLLRSLDAIHLATALRAPRVEVFLCHDLRLAEAARAEGLRVETFR